MQLSANTLMNCIRSILIERAAILAEIEKLDESDPRTEDLGENLMSLDRVFGELQDAYAEARVADPGYPEVDAIIEIVQRLQHRSADYLIDSRLCDGYCRASAV